MAIPESVIGGALGLATGLIAIFKKKKCGLWYQRIPDNGKSWIVKAGPMSARQCRKQEAVLKTTGGFPNRFVIVRWGVDPNNP